MKKSKSSPHSHEKFSVNLVGWIGASVLVFFYLLNIFGVISAQGLWYQLGNLAGGALLIFFAIKIKAWPNLMTNIVWMAAAAVAVIIMAVRA